MFFTLDHNFWTRNPSRSSKVSKDLDCSLVSNKNFSEILPSNSWRPEQVKLGQGGLKVLHLWRHSHKICTPQAKNFFQVQTRTHASSLEPFTRCVALTRPDKFLRKATCVSVFYLKNPQKHLDAKVLRIKLIENWEVQSRLLAGVSLSSNRVSALSVVTTERKLLSTGARAIVSASSASWVHDYWVLSLHIMCTLWFNFKIVLK